MPQHKRDEARWKQTWTRYAMIRGARQRVTVYETIEGHWRFSAGGSGHGTYDTPQEAMDAADQAIKDGWYYDAAKYGEHIV